MPADDKTGRRKECYLRGDVKFFRALVYQKIWGMFSLLKKTALTLRREGWQATCHKIKNRLWSGIGKKLRPKGVLKDMGLKTYLPPSEIHMKVDREELRKKLSECIEETVRKL